jgi:hypothetical protein
MLIVSSAKTPVVLASSLPVRTESSLVAEYFEDTKSIHRAIYVDKQEKAIVLQVKTASVLTFFIDLNSLFPMD